MAVFSKPEPDEVEAGHPIQAAGYTAAKRGLVAGGGGVEIGVFRLHSVHVLRGNRNVIE